MRKTKVSEFPLLLFGALFITVSLLTFYFGTFGFASSLLISFGVISGWYATEDSRRELYEAKERRDRVKAERNRFANELAEALENIAEANRIGTAYEALKLQCETAVGLSEEWEDILRGYDDLRTEEANMVVVFEETFKHYADRLSRTDFSSEIVNSELENGGRILLDFHKYLVLLAVKAEMG